MGRVVPGSFAAVAHLAPGLRSLGVYLDNLGGDAPSVIAELKALESLRLYGDSAMDEGRLLDDHALSMVAGLPALEYLALLNGAYTEQGLGQLVRLPKLRHLHIEREGLTVPMFRFAAAMPALTNLTGLDEFGDDGPMPPAEVQRVRALLPHISLDSPALNLVCTATPNQPRSPSCALNWPNSGRRPDTLTRTSQNEASWSPCQGSAWW